MIVKPRIEFCNLRRISAGFKLRRANCFRNQYKTDRIQFSPFVDNLMETYILIGGIASGKSTALAIFRELGIACFSADEIARECVATGTPYYQAIIEKCGPKIIDETDSIHRERLRKRMLQDKDFKSWLESLLHPEIRKRLIEKAAHAPGPYCVLEIPLLKNKTDYPHTKVLYIHTNSDRQKAFLKKRGLSQAEIKSLLAIQIPEKLSFDLADIVIENEGDLNDLKENILAFHQTVIKQKTP